MNDNWTWKDVVFLDTIGVEGKELLLEYAAEAGLHDEYTYWNNTEGQLQRQRWASEPCMTCGKPVGMGEHSGCLPF